LSADLLTKTEISTQKYFYRSEHFEVFYRRAAPDLKSSGAGLRERVVWVLAA
jgi:hypothetical protein